MISKIRCGNPNKKSTAIHNKNNFLYIGTREGTDLTPLEEENTEKFEKEMAKPEDYVRYIAKRSHSHGLFGNIPLDDIDKVSKYLYKLSRQKRLIYRGIVSLDPRDAEDLGYYDKSKWDSYIRSVIPDIADKFGISVENLQWTAAYHAEARHPHAHYMFWSSKPMVHDYFITEHTQNKCRELLSGKMFEEERQNEILNKEAAKNYILDFGKKLMPDEIKRISTITSGILHEKTIIPKITGEQLNKTTEELIKLIPMLPKRGQLEYAYIPADVKEQIYKVVDSILENKTVFKEYQKFMSSVDKMAKTYSPSKKELEHAVWEDNSEEDLRVKLSNIVLKNIKKKLKTHSNFSQYVETILKQLTEPQQDPLDIQLEISPTPAPTVTSDISNDNFTTIDNDILSSNFDTLDHDTLEEIDFQDFSSSLQSDEIDDKTVSDGSAQLCGDSQSSFVENNYYIEWDVTYKIALNELYKTHNYEKAIELLNISASEGNLLAVHDLGKVLQRGLGCIVNEQLAANYYQKALQGFMNVYKTDDNYYLREYAAYKTGKLFNAGNGIEKDIDLAEQWFTRASNNKYAQYSLAKIYIDKDIKNGDPCHSSEIISLLESASEKSPYASYELGNIYRKGFFTDLDSEKSYNYYNDAITKFNEMLLSDADDSLMYRVGKMYELGLGTEVNLPKAIKLFQEAGELKNTFALFSLAKIYLKSDDSELHEKAVHILTDLHRERPDDDMISYSLGKVYLNEKTRFYDISKAIEYLKKSANSENQFAQYQLGKIYSSENFGTPNYSLAISYLEASALQGNDFAMYQLGVLYKNSDLDFYNIDKAIEYLKDSSGLGNQFAQYQLGKIYSSSDFGEPDYPLAISYLEASAAQGNDFAMYQLGIIYKNSDLEFYDIDKAIDYFKSSAELENQFAQYQLGKIHSSSDFREPDYPLAISYLEASAAQGNDFAMYQLGVIYKNSDLEFYDIDKAIEYYKDSSGLGNQFAQYQLGKIYISSDFGKPNYPLAISYLEASATQGNDFAMYQLGIIYKNSDLEFYDIDKAIDYFKSSAELENQFAQYQLGKIYSSPGFGIIDYSLAISYLKNSAAQGNDFAMYQSGKIYSNKDIPIYNMDLAISYLIEAANKNNSFAQLQLGIIYLWGKGVKCDVTLGMDFLNKAINNGNPFAQQILDSYEIYRLQYAMNISYRLFTNIFNAITNENDHNSTIAADRYFRNLSKKAMIEEQLKNPHKHNHEPDK